MIILLVVAVLAVVVCVLGLDRSGEVRGDYEIPDNGEITRIAWRHESVTDSAFCGDCVPEALAALLVQYA